MRKPRIEKVAVLGGALSGRTETMKALGRHLGCPVERDPISGMLKLSFSIELGEDRIDFEMVRLDLLGPLHCESFQEAILMEPKVQHQADFLLSSGTRIFLVDGQLPALEPNLEAFRFWQDLCAEIGASWDLDSTLFLVNKMDLPNSQGREEWADLLGLPTQLIVEISSVTNVGTETIIPSLLGLLSHLS